MNGWTALITCVAMILGFIAGGIGAFSYFSYKLNMKYLQYQQEEREEAEGLVSQFFTGNEGPSV